MRPSILLLAAAVGLASVDPVAAQAPAQPAPLPRIMSSHPGKAIYDRWCAGCHDPTNGRDRAGTYHLRLRYGDERPAAIEQRADLGAAYVKAIVRSGRSFMPRTRKTEISDAELDQLAAYLSKGKP
jgi:mono/diheme cytochrome c family protein